jgi:hypothetical protein
MKNQKAKMENFKINDYTKEQKKSLEQKSSSEEFQNLNLDSLKSLDPVQQKEIVETQKRSEKEALEHLKNIYAHAELKADREKGSFLLQDDEAQSSNIVHFIHFKGHCANFETYEGREDKFSLRENQFKTQEELVQEIRTMKSIRREVPTGKRVLNIIRAISGNIAA